MAAGMPAGSQGPPTFGQWILPRRTSTRTCRGAPPTSDYGDGQEETKSSKFEGLDDSSRASPCQCSSADGSPLRIRRERVIFLCMGMNVALLNLAISILMPFFSAVALKKSGDVGGLGRHVAIGFIFSISTFAEFFVSPFAAKDLPIAGSKLMVVLSSVALSSVLFLFAFVDRIDDWSTFFGLCLAIRVVQGVATGAGKVSTYSIVVGALPENIGLASGVIHFSGGVGYALGPAMGGLLFHYAGFASIFYIGSALLMVDAVVLLLVLPSEEGKLSSVLLARDVSYGSLLRLPWVWIVLVAVFIGNSMVGYIEPTYPVYLKQSFGLSSVYSGTGLFIWGVAYSITSPLVGLCADRWPRPRFFLMAGLFVLTVACQLAGPASFLPFPHSLGLGYFALFLMAAGSSLIITSASPCLFQAVGDGGHPDPVSCRAPLAGLFRACMAFGYGMGPILGSTMTTVLGFPDATSLLGVVALCWGVVTLCVAVVSRQRVKYN